MMALFDGTQLIPPSEFVKENNTVPKLAGIDSRMPRIKSQSYLLLVV